jgi:hypothetical protein
MSLLPISCVAREPFIPLKPKRNGKEGYIA